jgi:hypothetical protein
MNSFVQSIHKKSEKRNNLYRNFHKKVYLSLFLHFVVLGTILVIFQESHFTVSNPRLFIDCLFNNAVSSSKYVSSNDKVVHE